MMARKSLRELYAPLDVAPAKLRRELHALSRHLQAANAGILLELLFENPREATVGIAHWADRVVVLNRIVSWAFREGKLHTVSEAVREVPIMSVQSAVVSLQGSLKRHGYPYGVWSHCHLGNPKYHFGATPFRGAAPYWIGLVDCRRPLPELVVAGRAG